MTEGRRYPSFLRASVFHRARMVAAGLLIGGTIAQFGSTVMFARVLSTASFGRYVVAITVATIMAYVAALGLTDGVTRYVGTYEPVGHRRLARHFVRFARLLTVIAATVVGGLFAAGAILFSKRFSASDLLALIVLVPALALLNLHRQTLLACRRVALSLGINVAVPAASIAILVILKSFGHGNTPAQAVACVGVATALGAGLQAVFIRHALAGGSVDEPSVDPPRRRWVSSGLLMHVNKVATYAMGQTDLIAVAIFVGPATAGIYGACSRTVNVITLVLAAAGSVDGPHMAAGFASSHYEEVRRRLFHSAAFAGAISLALAGGLALFSHQVLRTFGASYVAGATWLMVLSIGQIVNAATGPVGVFLVVSGQERTAASISSVCCVLSVVFVVIATRLLGPLGAAASMSAVQGIQNIWQLIASHRTFTRAIKRRNFADRLMSFQPVGAP